MKTRTLLLAIYLLSAAFLPGQAIAQIGSVKLTPKEIKRQNRQNEAYKRQQRLLSYERKTNPDVAAQQEKEQAYYEKRTRRETAEAARLSVVFANLEKKQGKSRSRTAD